MVEALAFALLGLDVLGRFARERAGVSLTLRLRRDDFACVEALVALIAAYSICGGSVHTTQFLW